MTLVVFTPFPSNRRSYPRKPATSLWLRAATGKDLAVQNGLGFRVEKRGMGGMLIGTVMGTTVNTKNPA